MELDTLHLALEISSAFWLFVIAWLNFHYKAAGKYSKILAIGASVAGVADIMHAMSTVVFPELLDFWVPLSWAMTRLTILSAFLLVAISDRVHLSTNTLLAIYIVPLITSIGIGASGWDISFVYEPTTLVGITVFRPLDLGLLIGWIVTAVALRSKARYLFPPNTYWPFMLIGMAVHAMMSFGSAASLDIMFFMAHAAKVAEYWTYILLYLWYKNIMDAHNGH